MDKNIAILQKLYELTKSGIKKWIPTNIVDQYAINVGKGKIIIDYNRPNDTILSNPFGPGYDYRAMFCNEKGVVIDQLELMSTDMAKPEYNLLANLWKEVEDSYLGKKETIDSMMEDLGLS